MRLGQYLFGFRGRINRKPMWGFVLVTLVWELVIALVGWIGWGSRYFPGGIQVGSQENWPFGAPIFAGPVDTAVLAVIAVLVLIYVLALAAVGTKRLHDRDKSGWWLLLFVGVPWAIDLLEHVIGRGFLDFGNRFGPLGVDRSGADLIAGVLAIWGFFELFVFRGTWGANRYGPDPIAPVPPVP